MTRLADPTEGAYLSLMLTPKPDIPAFLDKDRPPVPAIVVAGGITPFYLPRRPVRGRLIRLGPLADALLTRHASDPVVTKLSGEMLALTAGLASALKYQGSFSIQAKGDGPLPMVLADCTDAGELRGYTRADPERLAELLVTEPAPAAGTLLGEGYIAFSVDPGPGRERHQGIVSITGKTLTEMAMHYFSTSEQLACRVQLACEHTPDGWRASAFILEKVSGGGGIDTDDTDPEEQDEAWRTALALAGTLTNAELLDDSLAPEELIYRLFHQEGPAIDLPRALSYGCRCTRGKLARVLETFPNDDLDHMAIDGDIVMTCEFCNLDFHFPRQIVHSKADPA